MKIKEFKSKIFTWLNEPKWLNRLALYSSLGAVIIVVLHIVFAYFGFLHTDVDSARYMLSALVQGEAAIVALVVTLSLVAVQLAAQSYSARVIEVFRRTPDLWILMGIYGVAIFYGLGVLKMIEKAEPQVNSLSNLEGHIAFSYYLGVFAFVALAPYIWNILDLLKPSILINVLAEKISKENIQSGIRVENEEAIDLIIVGTEKDPFPPVIDIIRGALDKYDYETAREGLKAIGYRVNDVFRNGDFKGIEEKKISKHIFTQFTRIGKMAAGKNNEDSALEVITNLQKIGETTINGGFGEATRQIVDSLGAVGTTAAEKELEDVIKRTTQSLELVGTSAAKHNLQYATKQAATALANIGKTTAENKFEDATRQVVWSLGEIGRAAAEENIEFATKEAAGSLEIIGLVTIKYKLNMARDTAKSLKEIGFASLKYNLLNATVLTINYSLGRVGKASAKQGLEDATTEAIFSLKEVGIVAAKHKPERTVAMNELKLLGIAAEPKLEDITLQAIFLIEEIGIVAVENGLKNVALQAITYLKEVLGAAKEQKFEKATQRAAEAINRLNEVLKKLENK